MLRRSAPLSCPGGPCALTRLRHHFAKPAQQRTRAAKRATHVPSIPVHMCPGKFSQEIASAAGPAQPAGFNHEGV